MDSNLIKTEMYSPVKSHMFNGSVSSSSTSDMILGSSVSSTEGNEISSSTQNGELKNNGHNHSSSNSDKKHKHKDKHKDKHKHKSHKHDKDRDRHSSSKDKDKERDRKSSSDKHKSDSSKSESRSPERKIKIEDGVKVSSSSSNSKDKDRDKERHKEKDKSHKSKHKEKHREKEKHRDSDHKKEPSSSPEKKPVIKQEVVVKEENKVADEYILPDKKPQLNSDSEDDVPLSRRPLPKKSLKEESDSEDDIPLSKRNGSKRKAKSESDSDSDVPLSQRMKKVKNEPKKKVSKKRARSSTEEDSGEDSDYDKPKPKAKKAKVTPKNSTSKSRASTNNSSTSSPTKKGRKGKEEEQEEVWEWWKEAPREDGVKWNYLEHKGPVFAPPYEPLPSNIKFRYNGKSMKLSLAAEEVAGFYSRFIEHDYTTKETFNKNFFKDWRKMMNKEEKDKITDLKKCDFAEINDYYKQKSEERKAMSKEEKLKLKEENEAITKEYGICILDGHKEKIGNFRIEPPGLFRGRGEHPKMGMLKARVVPEDVIINCSKDSKVPQPPKGHKWKEIRHDNTVSWLASWTENVQGQVKYVMLNPTSRLKGEKDWMKYEKARELAKKIDKIRINYKEDFKSKEMRIRQRAVAMYFIDKLALRAGNEKDEDQADTVGCCSLRFEHIKLLDEKDGKENVVQFDFLGKDSIRYQNEVGVEKRVYKNLQLFLHNKKEGDDLFDRLNTQILNKHLSDLMEGLTAKVFRTYNASHTLQQQLDELTPKNGTVAEKVLAYNRANRAVAILCNHQRAAPKSHEKSMENLQTKIETKTDEVKKLKKELKGMPKKTKDYEKKHNQLKRAEEQLQKLRINRDDKEEGKEIALGTSKLNYLDPRITVAWCKKYDVPIEKAYNKTQRAKFRWAIDMVDEKYRFD